MPTAIIAVHPVLMARDIADSIRFYSGLGFTVIFLDNAFAPLYACIQRDAVELHLQWADPDQWAHPGDRPAYRLLIADVDALYAECVATVDFGPGTRGGPWVVPADTPWGTREFHLRDPGGNVLQFYSPQRANNT